MSPNWHKIFYQPRNPKTLEHQMESILEKNIYNFVFNPILSSPYELIKLIAWNHQHTLPMTMQTDPINKKYNETTNLKPENINKRRGRIHLPTKKPKFYY